MRGGADAFRCRFMSWTGGLAFCPTMQRRVFRVSRGDIRGRFQTRSPKAFQRCVRVGVRPCLDPDGFLRATVLVQGHFRFLNRDLDRGVKSGSADWGVFSRAPMYCCWASSRIPYVGSAVSLAVAYLHRTRTGQCNGLHQAQILTV